MNKLDKKHIESCIILSGAVVVIIFTVFLSTSQIRYPTEGQKSKERITAPFDFYYLDENSYQQFISSNFRPCYIQDLRIADSALARCEGFFDSLLDLRRLSYEVAKEKIYRDGVLKNLSSDILHKLLKSKAEEFQQFREKTKNLLKFWLVERGVVKAEDKKESYGEVKLHKISNSGIEKCTTPLEHILTIDTLTTQSRLILERDVVAMAMPFVSPNVYLDDVLTQGEKEKIIKDAKLAAQKSLKEGELIVEANSKVTKDALSKLKYLAMYVKRVNFLHSVGASIIVIVIFLLWAIWIYRYQLRLFETPKLMLLVMSLLLFIVFLSKFLIMKNLEFLIPLSVVAILSTILITHSVAYTLILVLCATVVLCNKLDLPSSLILFTGSIVSILLISKAKVRFQIIETAVLVCIANIIMFSAVFLLTKTKGQLISTDFMKMLLQGWLNWGLINSFFCCILTLPLLSLFENSFKIATVFKLVDLQDLNSQVLRELLIYAPGTHHHSLIVGALVQEAAKRISASVELACVGAYYHDIGKLKNPGAFLENNIYKSYSLSIDELRTHITDGIEIARQYSLPESIIDIIRQHHGSSLLPYILYSFGDLKEYEDKRNLTPVEGTKPTTKEAALVMLADIVEVAVRKISDHRKIKEIVDQIVHEFLVNGELSDANLTFSELKIISAVFTSKLIDMSTHHIYL